MMRPSLLRSTPFAHALKTVAIQLVVSMFYPVARACGTAFGDVVGVWFGIAVVPAYESRVSAASESNAPFCTHVGYLVDGVMEIFLAGVFGVCNGMGLVGGLLGNGRGCSCGVRRGVQKLMMIMTMMW
jgi:hypothetical protein